MKKLFPWQFFMLILWPYVAMTANLFLIHAAPVVWFCGLLGTLLVTVLNIRCALRQQEALAAARMGMLAKLIHIPAYMMSLVMAPIIWMAVPLLLLMLLTNLCMLLATSAYTLRGLHLAWRSGKLGCGWDILLAVSLCIFVLDVPGSVIAYFRTKARDAASCVEHTLS